MREQRGRSLLTSYTVIAAIISIVAGLGAIVTAILPIDLRDEGRAPLPSLSPIPTGLPSVEERLAEIERRLDKIELGLTSESLGQAAFTHLDKRLDAIEASILESPEKALQLPLLQREIDGLKQTINARFDAAQTQIDDVDEDSKWIVGGLGIGLFTIAIPVAIEAVRRGRSESSRSVKKT